MKKCNTARGAAEPRSSSRGTGVARPDVSLEKGSLSEGVIPNPAQFRPGERSREEFFE